jgi:hypothetical protein
MIHMLIFINRCCLCTFDVLRYGEVIWGRAKCAHESLQGEFVVLCALFPGSMRIVLAVADPKLVGAHIYNLKKGYHCMRNLRVVCN